MIILGISAFYHDSAACLVIDGQVVFASQEERYTRRKHDASFPMRAIAASLRHSGITVDDIDIIAFYERPDLKFRRILATQASFAPLAFDSFMTIVPRWLTDKIWVEKHIRERLAFTGEFQFIAHHLSHAASAFFPSPFTEAGILTIDGVGEWSTTTIGLGRGNEITLKSELRFPHSLGLLYSAFTHYCGFKVNSGEYKLMGLAPFGEPAFKDLILRELVDLKDDGSFRLNLRYFDYCLSEKMTNHRFDELFGGPPRRPEDRIDRRTANLARSIQEVTNEIMLRMARHLRVSTGLRNLCMAGGVALNCVANGFVHRAGLFDDIWIQPAAGDAGGALGAALCVWHHTSCQPRQVCSNSDGQNGSLLGPEYSSSELEAFLRLNKVPHSQYSESELCEMVSDAIADGKVVGWFQGRMEFGPRALGARSILGDARSDSMQARMNLKIKFRESFRPFAPAVLEERCADFFELNAKSPYMLLVAPVQFKLRTPPGDIGGSGDDSPDLIALLKVQQTRSRIPAVTHVDFSARVQTVSRVTNPLFHRLLNAMQERHGAPLVVNTSFNIRGEPIVCTPEDAYHCFRNTEIDLLVLGPYVVRKSDIACDASCDEYRKQFEAD